MFARASGQPEEWETLVRLTAIAKGKGSAIDPACEDDARFASDADHLFGEGAAAVLQAIAGLKGPNRLLDVALRCGPHGAGFASHSDGLTLARVQASSGVSGDIDLGELAPRLPGLLRTPSGKIELAPALLLADLQRAAADLASPAPDLVLVGRRDVRSNNSWMHNLPLLAKGPDRCTVLVHPLDAKRLYLVDGMLARICAIGSPPAGKADGTEPPVIEARVQVSEAMMPGVVSLPHGWSHSLPGSRLQLAAARPGANLNALLDGDLRDPLSGNAVLSGIPVKLSPAVPAMVEPVQELNSQTQCPPAALSLLY